MKTKTWTDEQTFDLEKAQTKKPTFDKSNSRLIICLLITILAVLFCVLASIIVMGTLFYIESNSEETNDMRDMARDMKTVMPQIKTFVPQITTVVGSAGDLNVTALMDKLKEFEDMARDVKGIIPKIKTLSDLNVTKLMHKLEDFEDMGRDMKTVMPKIKDVIPQITKVMDEVDSSGLSVAKLKNKLEDFEDMAHDVQSIIPKIKTFTDLNVTKLMDKFEDFEDMGHEMKTVMPKIKTFISDFNVTEVMGKLEDFEDMGRDMKTVMPQIKDMIPQITKVMDEVDSSGLSVTKLKNKLEDFEDMARDVQGIMPKIKTFADLNVTKLMDKFEDLEDLGVDMKTVMPQIKTFIPQVTTLMNEVESSDFNVSKLMDTLKDFDGLGDKLKDFDDLVDMLNNPVGALLDGVFEANTDISRWRAVGLKAADILQKLAKVDFTVSAPKIKWDVIQHCNGEFDDKGFQGHDSAIYKTSDENTCVNFNLNAVGARGHGMCVWKQEEKDGKVVGGECENKDDDEKAYRWIRNVDSNPGDIIPKSFSDVLQNRFVQIHKFASDFSGDPSKVAELKSESTIDLPLWVNIFMDSIQPELMQNVVDATDFLEKQSIMQVICEPSGGKENSNSCKWSEEGYVSSGDAGFKRILGIVRTIAKNVHQVWTA